MKEKGADQSIKIMNADLAAVNNRRPNHGGVGHPLRNRSASSNSGGADGSLSRVDPNRYKKYLSLRNRKILDNKHRQIEESSSHHLNSHRTTDSQ